MAIAMLALVGLVLATYLWLWKVGVVGTVACGGGACETVQFSEHAVIFGLPVAFYGVAGYGVLFLVAFIGLHGRWAARRGPTRLVAALSSVGVAFTAYLTYLEAAVIRAWCTWCLVSAALITAILVTALLGLRATPPGPRSAP
jgi:uncharacterized membrane protein